ARPRLLLRAELLDMGTMGGNGSGVARAAVATAGGGGDGRRGAADLAQLDGCLASYRSRRRPAAHGCPGAARAVAEARGTFRGGRQRHISGLVRAAGVGA